MRNEAISWLLVYDQAAVVDAIMPFGKVVHRQLADNVEMGLTEYDWRAIALALK